MEIKKEGQENERRTEEERRENGEGRLEKRKVRERKNGQIFNLT